MYIYDIAERKKERERRKSKREKNCVILIEKRRVYKRICKKEKRKEIGVHIDSCMYVCNDVYMQFLPFRTQNKRREKEIGGGDIKKKGNVRFSCPSYLVESSERGLS